MTQTDNKEKILVALVVEDDAITRLLVRRLMEQMGFVVCEAQDGEQAVREFQKVSPAIVITDISMPKMDGLTAITEIRKLENSNDIPIIIMSGIDDPQTTRKASELGVSNYLKKPINLQQFRAAISSVLPSVQIAS